MEVLPYIVWQGSEFSYGPIADEDRVLLYVLGHHLDFEIIMLDGGLEVGGPPDDGRGLGSEGEEEFGILG